ncbi:hypothetical protein F2P79_006767 [Pimephales promelas]|nr:hypothetical protein F2P79_006767 [Pimephales promelas]
MFCWKILDLSIWMDGCSYIWFICGPHKWKKKVWVTELSINHWSRSGPTRKKANRWLGVLRMKSPHPPPTNPENKPLDSLIDYITSDGLSSIFGVGV